MKFDHIIISWYSTYVKHELWLISKRHVEKKNKNSSKSKSRIRKGKNSKRLEDYDWSENTHKNTINKVWFYYMIPYTTRIETMKFDSLLQIKSNLSSEIISWKWLVEWKKKIKQYKDKRAKLENGRTHQKKGRVTIDHKE